MEEKTDAEAIDDKVEEIEDEIAEIREEIQEREDRVDELEQQARVLRRERALLGERAELLDELLEEIDGDEAIEAAGGVYASPHNLVADPDLYERGAESLAVLAAQERREISDMFGAALQDAIDTGRARFTHFDGSVRLGPGPDDPLAPQDPDEVAK